MSTVQHVIQSAQHCPFCGKPVPAKHAHCPHCREAVPQVRLGPVPVARSTKGGQIKRGVLYMALGIVIHYVALRSDTLNLPFSVNPTVSYLSTMLFLGGVALTLYGFFSRVTA